MSSKSLNCVGRFACTTNIDFSLGPTVTLVRCLTTRSSRMRPETTRPMRSTLGPVACLHRPHHGGHLPGASRRRLRSHARVHLRHSEAPFSKFRCEGRSLDEIARSCLTYDAAGSSREESLVRLHDAGREEKVRWGGIPASVGPRFSEAGEPSRAGSGRGGPLSRAALPAPRRAGNGPRRRRRSRRFPAKESSRRS